MAKRRNTKRYYVPPSVIEEVDDIKREDCILSQAEAMKKMVKYCRVGRETKRLYKFDWSKKKKPKKKKRGIFI